MRLALEFPRAGLTPEMQSHASPHAFKRSFHSVVLREAHNHRSAACASLPRRRRVGSSDLEVSELTFGCMLFGEGNDRDQSQRLLSVCTEHGINAFDVAEMCVAG